MKETILNITITMTIRLPLPPTLSAPAAAAMQPEDKERLPSRTKPRELIPE